MSSAVNWILAGVALWWIYIHTTDSGGDNSTSVSGIVDTWASMMATAMAKFENSNPAYNNPLAIQGTGDTGQTAGNGLGIFSTFDAGMQAGIQLLESYASRFPDLTITQALARWTNNTTDLSTLDSQTQQAVNNEAGMVGDALGVDPNQTTLGDLAGSSDTSDP